MSDLSKIKILVVDDDEPVRNFMVHVLKKEGYDVLACDDGSEVTGMIQENPGVSLVVTDILMPGQDGIETMTALKAQWPHIRVIVISGIERKGTLLQIAGMTGADATLEKPFERATLLETVKSVLGL